MFASTEGFSSSLIESLYRDRLLPTYEALLPKKEIAKKRKTTYIISAILAVVLFLVFAKFFKLTGVIVALMMIGAGYYVLKNSGSNVVGDYEREFKEKIITPIGQNCCGFSYEKESIKESLLEKSDIFAPSIKLFKSVDLYKSEDSMFSYIQATFNTKESASVERMNENIFKGYFIIINKPNSSEGILVSDSLREKVSNMDLEMNSFFANAKRADKIGAFTTYGEVSKDDIDRLSPLSSLDIAISLKKDATYVVVYKKENLLNVDPLKGFNLESAKSYEEAFKEVSEIISKIR
jgi:hypothetical protein